MVSAVRSWTGLLKGGNGLHWGETGHFIPGEPRNTSLMNSPPSPYEFRPQPLRFPRARRRNQVPALVSPVARRRCVFRRCVFWGSPRTKAPLGSPGMKAPLNGRSRRVPHVLQWGEFISPPRTPPCPPPLGAQALPPDPHGAQEPELNSGYAPPPQGIDRVDLGFFFLIKPSYLIGNWDGEECRRLRPSSSKPD